MQYNAPVRSTDPNAAYINADASQGIKGSSPPAEAVEYPQREIVNAIMGGGLFPANSDLDQLDKVIKRSAIIYAVDIGAANHMIILPDRPLTAYAAGVAFEIKVAVNNTGATDINVSGLGIRPVLRVGGAQLVPNDIVSGGVCLVVYDGAVFQLLTSANSLVSEQSLVHYGVDTGLTNALVATVSPGISSLKPGDFCLIFVAHTNTGASTINVSSLGVKNITRNSGAAVSAGDLIAGGFAEIGYDGTNWELLNPQQAASGGTSSLDESIAGPLRPYFIAVNSATTSTPPGSPAIGDTYCVPVGATGAWSGLANQITQWTGSVRGWVTVNFPTQSMIGIGDSDDFWKRTVTGWRTIFASVAEAMVGLSTTLALTPACLLRAATIVGPLSPYFIAVKSATTTAPPGSPTKGDVYCVPAGGATGAWSGFGNYLAQWDGTQWLFRDYPIQSMIGIGDVDDFWKRTGTGWRSIWATPQEALLGISTSTGVTPADLFYVLSQQQGGDDLLGDLFYYGCL